MVAPSLTDDIATISGDCARDPVISGDVINERISDDYISDDCARDPVARPACMVSVMTTSVPISDDLARLPGLPARHGRREQAHPVYYPQLPAPLSISSKYVSGCVRAFAIKEQPPIPISGMLHGAG